ncbi:MAG: ScpA family protein [Pseudomonadota bacterium]
MPEDLLELAVEAFDQPPRDQTVIDAETLSVNVEGYEGPLDLLLTLARTQKVDIRKVSILQLAEQYLEFVSAVQTLRIELAADYLVMAAWLAFLKSRLLLPPPHAEDEPSGEELAARLAFQLERLEAMRKAAAQLMARDQLGHDFFARAMTESVTVKRETTWKATLSDLLKAYSRVRTREEYKPLHVDRGQLWTMDQALERLKSVVGAAIEWKDLAGYLPEGFRLDPKKRRSALASTFAASLELAKRGEIELSQDAAFAPIFLRRRERAA